MCALLKKGGSASQVLRKLNPVDKTKLSCYTPHRRSTTVSLETYPLYFYYDLF